MRRVEWTDSAVADLRNIQAHLTGFGNAVAEHTIETLVLATYWLLDHPGAGSVVGYRRWRKWKPRGQRYLLLYEPTPFGISVVRVRHERNDRRPVPA